MTTDILRGGSRVRLRALKAAADKRNAYPHMTRKITWREAYHRADKAYGMHQAPRYASIAADELGLRFVGYADKLIDFRRKGYYADAFQDEVYRGAIWQLPTHRHRGVRYVVGYTEPNSGTVVLAATNGILDTEDDKHQAAYAADSFAEYRARDEREYSEAYEEASKLDREVGEAQQAVKDLRWKTTSYINALRDQSAVGALAPSVCAILRERILRSRTQFSEELQQLIDKRAEFNAHPLCGEV